MFGLIPYRDTGFTELLFITRIMALSVFPAHRLCRFSISKRASTQISRSPIISVCRNISDITYISRSPFMSVRQNITALISYHWASHNRYIYRPYRLSWFFSYPSLPASHDIIISVLRVEKYLISRNVARWEISQLVIWQVPMRAECQIQPRTAVS